MFTCISATHRNSTITDCPLRRTVFKIVTRSGQVFKVLIKGKVETVTADHVKPAHIEGTPENERTMQPTATPTLEPTASQPTAKIHEPRTAIVGKQSTTTSKPSITKTWNRHHEKISNPPGRNSNLPRRITNLPGRITNLLGRISNLPGQNSNLPGQISIPPGQIRYFFHGGGSRLSYFHDQSLHEAKFECTVYDNDKGNGFSG